MVVIRYYIDIVGRDPRPVSVWITSGSRTQGKIGSNLDC